MKLKNWLCRCAYRHYWQEVEITSGELCPEGHRIVQAQNIRNATAAEIVGFVTGEADES